MGSIFKSKTTAAPAAEAPVVTPPAPMPDTSSAGVTEANRRAQQAIMARQGRSSTILTAPENRGNAAYTATRLGTSA